METADELEYLTVDNVSWSKGYTRSRMSAEERKPQHRLTQRSFIARKRARVDRLVEVVRRYKLILKWVTARVETSRLQLENTSMSLDVDMLVSNGLTSQGIVRQPDHDDVANIVSSLPELVGSKAS